ncbi:MAG: cytosine deaminase [Thermoflexaceae bacterium]|nr:cytosine deaminase [Thermoflexaceae bacterium]
MRIKNCRIRGREGLYDVACADGKFTEIVQHKEDSKVADDEGLNAEEFDAKGRMMMPPFVEPHIHLDCVLTAGIPHYNMSGTLFEGISTWDEYKTTQPLAVSEIKERARAALRLMAEHGVQFVRTHVDVTETSFKGVCALEELKEEMKGIIEIQTIAFPQNGIISLKNGRELMIRAMDMGMDCVGGIPHYEYTREYGLESIKFIFDLAEKYDACVDVHCDEIDDGQSRFLEVLATTAWERGWGERTVAAHTCAMGSYNDAYCSKLFRLLKDSGIRFNSCPPASTHLQGRIDTFPKRRGLTRIKELTHAGMNVALGQDSISDPWYPLGVGNLLRVLEMGVHVAQMTGYEDLSHCLDLISTNGARNLCLKDSEYGIETGKDANFILLDGKDDLEVLRFQSPVLLSVHNGKIISRKEPVRAEVSF